MLSSTLACTVLWSGYLAAHWATQVGCRRWGGSGCLPIRGECYVQPHLHVYPSIN